MDPRPTLLIVDDERGPAESLRMIFKPSFDVFVANSGPAALDILHSTPVDVVTLDLRMPIMSGVEVMERIKRHDPDIEVIIVTGYSSVDTAIHALRHGVFDYVSKPFDVPHISDLVRRAVDRRRASLRNRVSKEDFLANVSHELRTPLNAILGYSAILAEELEGHLNEDQQFALRRLQSNSFELFKMVESVMLLNELDANEVAVTYVPFDLASTVSDAVQKFRPLAEEKGLTLRAEGSASLPMLCDREKIDRVLWALLDNSVKFTESGEICVRVRLADPRTVRLDVIDTGIGMDGDESNFALGGLTQIDGSHRRRFRGLGLGFRIATRLLELLGGRIEVSSRAGSGTSATVWLPLQPGPQTSLH